MGFYLRKSFRAGPIRFNLSKSGLGLSAGVKGARVGTGPKGRYVHGGRHGLYYRKYASSGGKKRSRNVSSATGGGESSGLGTVIGAIAGIFVVVWLLNNPWVLAALVAVAILAFAAWFWKDWRDKRVLERYRAALDDAFVREDGTPGESELAAIRDVQSKLPDRAPLKKKVGKIEADVYQAVLDRVLDDGRVTDAESERIRTAEDSLRIDEATQRKAKKEIFSSAYIEAIEDRRITEGEFNNLRNLADGLGIPRTEIERELSVVNDILEAQSLSLPFEPIPHGKLDVRPQKSEEAYFQCKAQVLTRRKCKSADSGYEYRTKRDGILLLTQKRLFVVDRGTTSVRYGNLADVDYDIDLDLIVISKSTSSRPVFLRTESPIYTARVIDLLAQAHRSA